jgi:hypothetical protein
MGVESMVSIGQISGRAAGDRGKVGWNEICRKWQ